MSEPQRPKTYSMQRIAEELNVSELALQDAITDGYARYDADQRVHGPDDFEAFCEAYRASLAELLIRERHR
jgi:hypothetical protein